jgi:TetR/AcrR family transcriptional regulator, transcriptional repressor for nem operon
MGYSKASKANTHARLVESAAARFKERGVDGISLADLMKDLKLTHGGFYKHFASRDELVNEALDLALSRSGEIMRDHLYDGDKPNVAGFVDFYLNEAHRDGRASGCAVAALAGDAPRKSADVQERFHEYIERTLATLGDALGPGSPAERRETALLVLSSLYGALMMARAVGDSPLSIEVLRSVRKRVVNLPGVKRVGNLAGAKNKSRAQSRAQTHAQSKAIKRRIPRP